MKTKNILFVARSFQMGGQEKISVSILEYLADNGYHIVCFAFKFVPSFMSDRLIRKGISFHKGTVYDLYKLMKSNHFDAIYICAEFYSSIVLILAMLCGIRVRITHTHQTQTERKKWKLLIKNYILRLIINMLATTRLACSIPAGHFLYGLHTPFVWVRNGIDIENFSFKPNQREEIRSKLGLEAKFVIGNVGRFDDNKNQIFIFDILRELLKKNPHSICLLAGKGDTEASLKEYAKKLHLEQKIIFCGEVTNPSLFYQAMDCFIFPSFKEGLGLVAIEAQCAGLPCFISDGVPKEAIICNTVQIPLSKSAEEWAKIILDKTKDFRREDCSDQIKKAGYNIDDTVCQFQEEYLK